MVAPLVASVPAFPSPLAVLGTFLLYWAVYAYAAQVAATFFLGDVPWRRALLPGLVLATVNVALVRYSPAVVVPVALAADFATIHVVYRLRYRTTVAVTVLHAAVAVAFTVVVAYALTLLSTAPG
ncbi:MAG: hypothetical protein ABEJ57_09075 [Halobacteriaceae archaeon]